MLFMFKIQMLLGTIFCSDYQVDENMGHKEWPGIMLVPFFSG